MNLERRSLLKGMALGGLAGIAMGGSGLALARSVAGGAAAQPMLVLISPAVGGVVRLPSRSRKVTGFAAGGTAELAPILVVASMPR